MLTFDTDILFQLGFYIAVLIFTIHAIVLSYHWMSYGAKKSQSLLSLAVYLTVGSILLLALSINLSYI